MTFKILMILFTGVSTVATWNHGLLFERIFLTLFLYSVASLMFRWGWVVPCIVAGTIWGISLDNVVKGGSHESQMWETVNKIWFGFACGFLLGLSIDTGFFFDKPRSDELHNDKNKDSDQSN